MRDKMERFVLLPFTAGCMSESSIAVGMQQVKRSKMDSSSNSIIHTREEKDEGGYSCDDEEEEDEESLSGENMKSPSSLLALPRFQKLVKNFRNISQLFVYKDDEFGDETDEIAMEIGFPTNVKHVTHIGLDGSSSSILSKGWNDFQKEEEEEELNKPSSVPVREAAASIEMRQDHSTATIRSLLQNNKCINYQENLRSSAQESSSNVSRRDLNV